ncbi:MAG: pyruvate dehydrogenase (acetyl-transferring) E1 component subunit alpha [Candidatus Micrarchaeia archaeon]
MPLKKVVEFKIEHLSILNQDGSYDESLEPRLPRELLDKIYRTMVLERTFDAKALSLQRQGRLLTYAPSEGEEATHVASAFALEEGDWLFPSYREHGAYFARGLPPKLLFLSFMGSEDGNRIPDGINAFTIIIPIASQVLHATGAALADRLLGRKRVSLVFFGDGGTSEGDFHEGLNFAGTFKCPIVFVCRNNQYAISVPRERQTASETLAQKALAYGFPGIQVDGNDVLAVYKATRDAVERARAGQGPTLIECLTYRIGPHTTADDPTRYRSEEEVAAWRRRDPVERFRNYLKRKGLWSEAYEEEVAREAQAVIEEAVKEAEAHSPSPTAFFHFVFEKMTPNLLEQEEELKKYLEEKARQGG